MSNQTNKLLNGPVAIPFYPVLGEKLGITEALVFQQLHFWLGIRSHYHQGTRWSYNTYENWVERMAVFSRSTIHRALKTLTDLGLIETGNFNKHKYDRTVWYTINYRKFTVWASENDVPSEYIQIPSWYSPECQIDTILGVSKELPIPESSSESTKENKPLPTKPALKKNIMSAKEIQDSQAWKNKKKMAHSANNPTPDSMYEIWKKVVPKLETSAGCLPILPKIQLGVLGKIAKLWGNDAHDIFEFVLSNWIGYTKHVEKMSGLYKTPDAPSVMFLMKHQNEALIYWKANATNCTEDVQVKPEVPSAVKPKGKIVIQSKKPLKPEDEEQVPLDVILSYLSI